MQIIIALLVLLASTNISWAACSWNGNVGTAASLTPTEIGYCINDASTKTGEVTIYLPAGAATWNSGISVNMSSGFANVTSLRIFGAGVIPTGSTTGAASSGGTTINVATNYPVVITGSTAKKFRMSNITWTGGVDQTGYFYRLLGTSLPSSGGGFRIDHNTWNNMTTRTRKITTEGRIYGVIDHNYYRGAAATKWFGMFGDIGEGSLGANQSWYRGIGVNSWDQVFFEDNDVGGTYTGGSATFFSDCTNGGRIVARYNTIRNMYFGGHGADSVYRSCLSYIMHDNTINIVDSPIGDMNPIFDLRDGTHIAYDNAITETRSGVPVTNSCWGGTIYLRNYRSSTAWSNARAPFTLECNGSTASNAAKGCFGSLVSSRSCSSDSDCGGEVGSCYKVDNASGDHGYQCRDQMGITSNGGLGSHQFTPYPSLFANNTLNGTYKTPTVPTGDYNSEHIQNNRDYCHHSTTLPATCNSVETEYSEMDYPHPLTGGGGESDTTDPILSAWFPTTQQTCSADPQTISIGITSSDQNITTCKWDTSTAAYADLTNTFDGAASGTVNHTDSASFACGVTHTIYYACQDAEGNTTDTASYTFSLPALLDETTPVITNVTSSTQAVALVQKLSVTTSVAGSCRYCVNGIGGCAYDTAWASRTAFSVTGGETTHHEVSITQAASSSATYNVICQNTQGTATSANSAITITTDAAKTITAGAGSLSITQGSGSLSVTILP